MSIRILHLIGSLRLGGAQIVVKQITENASDEFEHYVYPLRAEQIDIPIKGQVIYNPYFRYDLRKFFDILRVCRQHKIDIIHAHLHKPIIGALLAQYFINTPVIVHEHGPITRKGIQYSAYRVLLRLLKNKADSFIAVSKAIAAQLTENAGIDPAEIKIIYNAVDLEKFTPDPNVRRSVRQELNITPEQTVIGFVGRLADVKGPDILLEAFGLLREEMPEAVLVYVGKGPMEQKLSQMARSLGIESRVKFLGFQENVAHIMNTFDLGCMPSRQEPFGIAALEMMSMRIPLVSSNVQGLMEIVQHRQNALVPETNTPFRIAECLREIAGDHGLKENIIEGASQTAQMFSIPNLVNQLNPIYRHIKNLG